MSQFYESNLSSYQEDPINFPSQASVTNSFFHHQAKHLGEMTNNTTVKNNIINIDSEARPTINVITSRTISTRQDFLWSHDGVFRIAVKNPEQLISRNNHNGLVSKNQIPEQIIITINSQLSHGYPSNPSNFSLGGLAEHEVIFNESSGSPFFYAELDSYLGDHDEAWYILKDVYTTKDGKYGSEGQHPLILKHVTHIKQGYPNPNCYNVSFKTTYRNITNISLISSEFPKPIRLTINGLKPSFFAEVEITNLNNLNNQNNQDKLDIKRSITLRPQHCRNDLDLTLELANSLSQVLYDYQLIPLVTKNGNTKLSILNLTVSQDRAEKYQLDNTNRLLIKIKGDYNFQFNETVLVKWDGILSYYRVVETHTIKIAVEVNGQLDDKIAYLSPLYLDGKEVGYFVRTFQQDGQAYLIVTSEMDDAFQIGNRLNFGPLNTVVQITDMIILGNGLNLLLEYLKTLNTSEILSPERPNREGIYSLSPFRLVYPEDSILETSSLSNLETFSPVKISDQNTYTIPGQVINSGNNTSRISFQTRDLPAGELGFQINQIKNQSRMRNYDGSVKYLEVIMAEPVGENSLKIYIRNNDTELFQGQWVNLVFQNLTQEYLPIQEVVDSNFPSDSHDDPQGNPDNREIESSGPTIIVDLLLDSPSPETLKTYSQVRYLKVKDDEILIRKTPKKNIRGILTDSCLRSHRKLPVTTADNFSPGYIIKIGNDLDGKIETNSELNIIEQVVENHDEPYLITKHPLSNSRLEGTNIQQLYPILRLTQDIKAGDHILMVYSGDDISTRKKLIGSLNWLSSYLSDFSAPLESNFISEETIFVKGITKAHTDNTYLIHLSYPVKHNYHHGDAYLVLFLEKETDPNSHETVRDVAPSSLNYYDGQDWYTGFATVKAPGRQNIPTYLNIYAMESENIPVFGLSDSDIATRGMEGLDITSNMEHLSDFITAPVETIHLTSLNDKPEVFHQYQTIYNQEMVVVRGRYCGRGGMIRQTDHNDQLQTNLHFSNVVAHKSHPGKVTCYLSRDLLPNDLRDQTTDPDYPSNPDNPNNSNNPDNPDNQNVTTDKIDPIDILVNVTPKNHQITPKEENYHYFYLCCQELPNIQTTNGDIGKYKALDGWSFLNNSNYPVDELNTRQQSMSYRHLLNNIFAKIQVDTTSQHYSDGIMYNTFVKTGADFSQNPIREISNLTFVCLWPDGQLVDFGYQNHSFTLEITQALGTLSHINPITGTIS